MQHTVRSDIQISGIALHSGVDVNMYILPAPADHGIVFVRSDINPAELDNVIPARWDKVTNTTLCTVISNNDGVEVKTIEHLMAALRGAGVDNALIEIDAGELPILDGSAAEFLKAIEKTGLKPQYTPKRAIRILKEIAVVSGNSRASLTPSVNSSFSGMIDFAHPDIGIQKFETTLVNGNFRHDLADCRTFGLLRDVDALRAAGLAKGGSLKNAVVVGDNGIMNPEGLRCSDEFVRHKLLDAVGDMYLAGGIIIGHYEGIRPSHALNNALLHKLFSDKTSWEMVDMLADIGEDSKPIYSASSSDVIPV